MERGWKPNVEICPPCPRCGSSNTKFCYYNNYSLTQPRYFCKGCRRYWTKGGSLRNIPVGGGCRKTRRAKSIRVSDTFNSQNFHAHGRCGATDYGNHENVENHVSGGGSTMMQPTNIDIQQVYANFLNQRPQITHHDQVDHDRVLMLGDHENPMTAFGFPSIPNIEVEYGVTNFGSNLESILSEGSGMQFCGYNSIFNTNNNKNEEDQGKHYNFRISNCGLPPLPGEELGWSETNIAFPEDVLNPRIEPEVRVSGECSDKLFGADTMFRP